MNSSITCAPIPIKFNSLLTGTDGEVDWVISDDEHYPAVSDTIKFQTFQAVPIRATFSFSVDVMEGQPGGGSVPTR